MKCEIIKVTQRMNRLDLSSLLSKTAFLVLFGASMFLSAQSSNDYFGNGNTLGVTVTGSTDDLENDPQNTIIGDNKGQLPDPEADAARFLHQATLGATYEEIQALSTQSYESWMDEQMTMEYIPFWDNYPVIWNQLIELNGDIAVKKSWNVRSTKFMFYTKVLREKDALRQKMAFALSQIIVCSFSDATLFRSNTDLNAYYDRLYNHAFGNFRDILQEVTECQAMSIYLTYLANRVADPELGTTPDENYAREVMQLFTIGLWELNMDGTRKKDAEGNDIPTYDIDDIQEMAKIFTGYRVATDEYKNLRFLERLHDNTEKVILGHTLPANNGIQDISDALDILFNHDNTPPFISYRLIQQFVKSNPTPAYVERVANVFVNNGEGVRGDLGAVIKAILLDPEARDCQFANETSSGKLIQPIQRFTMIWKAFKVETPSGKLFPIGDAPTACKQEFLHAPSVFNYFLPDHAENQIVAPAGLVSPEFQIFDNVSSIQYLNWMEKTLKDIPFDNYTGNSNQNRILQPDPDDAPFFDFSYEMNLYNTGGTTALLNHLNVLLCRNTLDAQSQATIENTLKIYAEQLEGYDADQAVRDAIYFVAVTPAFTILK